MHKTPDFKPPVFHRDAAAALAQVQAIYQASVEHLRAAMREFVAGHDFAQTRVRACYPFVRLHTHSVTHKGSSRLSYGFVAGPGLMGIGLLTAAAAASSALFVAPDVSERPSMTAREYNDAVLLGRVLLAAGAPGVVVAAAGAGILAVSAAGLE